MLDNLTAVTVNWRTLDLIRTCVRSLLRFYPGLQLVVIDNGSADASTRYIRKLAEMLPNVTAILNLMNVFDYGGFARPVGQVKTDFRGALGYSRESPLIPKVMRAMLSGGNVGHGPALHQFLTRCRTRYALGLDSDCVVQSGGFVEDMLDLLVMADAYAVGRIVYLDKNGRQKARGWRHIHESAIIWDVEKYRQLMPYVHFGVPSVFNMPDAERKGFMVVNYEIGGKETEVYHPFQGSRRRFHGMPKTRTAPIMPEVLLDGLRYEVVGDYFE